MKRFCSSHAATPAAAVEAGVPAETKLSMRSIYRSREEIRAAAQEMLHCLALYHCFIILAMTSSYRVMHVKTLSGGMQGDRFEGKHSSNS